MESYTYDRLGNRLTKRVEGVLAASYEYDAMNRLISAREGESTTRFTYDRRGNLTEESRGTSRRCAYTYDTAGRMVTDREAAEARTTGAVGRCIRSMCRTG